MNRASPITPLLFSQCIIFASLLLLSAFALLSQTPNYWELDWIWDNEKLLPFDHLYLANAGASLLTFNLARIPSLAPDYGLAWLMQGFWNDIRQQYLGYLILQSCIQLALGSWIVQQIARLGSLPSLAIFATVSYALGSISPAWATNHSLAALPLNHGGNLCLVLLIFALSLKAVLGTQSRSLSIGLGLSVLVASLSNRISVLQAVLPAFLLFALPELTPVCRRNRQQICIWIASCTGLGLVLSKLALKTGCTPPLQWNWDDLARHLSRLFSLQPWHLGLGFWITINLLLCIGLFWKSEQTAAKAYGFLIGSSSVLSLLLYPFILSNQGLSDDNLRYLLPTLSSIPITASLFIGFALRRHSSWTNPFCIGCALALSIVVLNPESPFGQVKQFTNAFLQWENPYSQFLRENLPEGGAVLTASDGNYLLSSRSLKAGTNWGIHVSQIASNGNPNPWDQGKAEFFENQSNKTLRRYNAILIPSKDHDQAMLWYGKPKQIIENQELGVELGIYGAEGQQEIARRLAQEFKGSFRIHCL